MYLTVEYCRVSAEDLYRWKFHSHQGQEEFHVTDEGRAPVRIHQGQQVGDEKGTAPDARV